MVLAALVTVGLMTFYLNSQGLWLDGSSQALTQRDATLVLERITRQTHSASSASVASDPDPLHQMLVLLDSSGGETARFFWNSTDSLIHSGTPAIPDEGPIAGSRVIRIQFDTDNKVVYLRSPQGTSGLIMRSTTGELVELTSSMALYSK